MIVGALNITTGGPDCVQSPRLYLQRTHPQNIRDQRFGVGVTDSGIRVLEFGFWVQGSGLKIQFAVCRVQG